MTQLYANIFQYIAVAILIGIIIAFANYVLNFSKNERQRKRNAKIEFRSIFETDLKTILESGDDARHIFMHKEGSYKGAIEEFRKYLLFWQLTGFDKAWNIFFYHPENAQMPYLEQYMDFGSTTKRKACHALLRSRIQKILSYAKVRP